MKLNLISALLVLTSALSVVSCSKSEKDNWTPGTPRIEWDQHEMMPLLEPTKRSVPSTAAIIFPGDAIARADVHSYCTSGEARNIENAAFDISIANQNWIEIPKILPASIWRNLDYKKLGRVKCDFKFSLFSREGSAWSFTVQNLELSDLEKLENFRFDPSSTQFFKGNDIEYNLMCEHFQNYRKLSDSQMLTEILSELLDGRVSNRYGTAEIVDTRLKYGLQKCRLSIEKKESNGASERLVSQVFEGRFKAPDIEIKAKLDFGSSLTNLQRNNLNGLEVFIHNKSPIHVAYRLYDLLPNNLSVQLIVMRSNNAFHIGHEFKITFNYSIENANQIFTDGDHRVFEIAPHNTAKIIAKVNIPLACNEERNMALSPAAFNHYFGTQGAAYVGYKYRFKDERFLERILNWDPSRRDYSGPTQDTKLFGTDSRKTTHPDRDYSGWAPFDSWIAVGKGLNPSLSSGRLSLNCEQNIGATRFTVPRQ